jgi:hypothetical protein
MKREVDLRDRLLLVNGAKSIIDLDSISNAIRHLSIVGVHDWELEAKRRTFYLADSISRPV